MQLLNDKQLSKLRDQLVQEREEIEKRIRNADHYGLDHSMRDETGELSPIDNHPGDLGTEMYERSKDSSLLEQDEFHLSRISAALEAIDNGSYGKCLNCGRPIPYERLEALPDTLYCIDHSPRQELTYNRPVEEEFLDPPFGRTSFDEQSSYNGFDGEDAWQIVEQWGNASSPAMSDNRDVSDYNHLGSEANENDGYVESLESFLATDITGRYVTVIRNDKYEEYMKNGEGDHELETDQ